MKLLLVALALLASACSGTPFAPSLVKGGSSPVADFQPLPFTNVQSFAIIAGGEPWSGQEIADPGHGENGDINLSIFTATDSGYISARIQFVGRLETVNGSLSGDTISGFKLVADAGGTPTGTRCEYAAIGAYRVEGSWEILSGRYVGVGPAPCPNKQGQWSVRRAKPLCVGSGQLTFPPPHNAMAIYPPSFPLPTPLPQSLGLFPFAVPAGAWDITLVTGHYTHPDVDQAFEIVRVPFYGAGDKLLATVQSIDVDTADPTRTTRINGVVLSEASVQLKVLHGYDGPPVVEPTYSVTIESVAWSCPGL